LKAATPLSPPNWGGADREGSEEEKEAKKKRKRRRKGSENNII
jgi:hypothetical protein